ncbi:MAG: M23 family metallopeptidase [Gemmatimonadota bacterium]
MARELWTIMLVPEGRTGVRQIRTSRAAAQLAALVALVVVVAASALATVLVLGERRAAEAVALEQHNALLRAELGALHGRIDVLRTTLDTLSGRDDTYRLLAGLEPLDEDVRQVGIGGPGGPVLENGRLFPIDPSAARTAFAAAMDIDALLRRARLVAVSWRDATDSLQFQHEILRSTPSILPTDGVVTSGFSSSRVHPILHEARAHNGMDIVARRGDPILASAAGRVIFAGTQGDYGQMVALDHGRGLETRYAHASKLLVKRGQRVARGDTIALVGMTGLAVAPHLHYEVLLNGRPANPQRYILNPGAIPD